MKDELGKDCSVAVNEGINSGSKSVTVSFAGNQSMTPEEQKEVASTLTSAYDAVSYTHLDVYKRQGKPAAIPSLGRRGRPLAGF